MVPRAVPIAASVTAVATVAVLAERAAAQGEIWGTVTIASNVAVGLTTVVAGVVAWLTRPDSRVGPALVALAGLFFLGDFAYGDDMALVDLVGFPLQGWHEILLVGLLLAVSPGGLRGRAPRLIVGGVIAAYAVVALARLLLRPPLDISSCLCVGNRITGLVDPTAYETVQRFAFATEAVFAILAVGLLGQRFRSATPTARRTLGWLLAAGAATVTAVAYNRVVTRVLDTPRSTSEEVILLLALVRMTVPIAVAASLVRGRRARGRVADVLIGLDEHEPATVALRRAFADPSARLLRWDATRGAYADDAGSPAELPVPGGPLAATPLDRDGVRLGALVHDATLREEPELLNALAAAARLALLNERLVAGVDAERRRLERDLHDGAQQRLLGVAMRLRALERQAGSAGDVTLADGLDAATTELEGALGEIRALARGIRPALLVESGLGPALGALAAGVPLPVDLELDLPRRLPEAVESTVYFAAAEALANVLRHSQATRIGLTAREADGALVVSIADNGRGGAALRSGGGLGGLADRLEALGGSLSVGAGTDGGTEVRARAPVAPQPVARR